MGDEKNALMELAKCFFVLFFVIIPGILLFAFCFAGAGKVSSAIWRFLLIGGVYGWVAVNAITLIIEKLSEIEWHDLEDSLGKSVARYVSLMLVVILAIVAPSTTLTLAVDKIFPTKETVVSNDCSNKADEVESEEEESEEENSDVAANTENLVVDTTGNSETESENLDWAPIEEWTANDQSGYVYVTPTGSCYHTLDCPTLSHTKRVKPYLLSEVPTEYTNCSVCDPLQYD